MPALVLLGQADTANIRKTQNRNRAIGETKLRALAVDVAAGELAGLPREQRQGAPDLALRNAARRARKSWKKARKGAVDVRVLAALMAIRTRQHRAAVEAVGLVRVAVGASPGRVARPRAPTIPPVTASPNASRFAHPFPLAPHIMRASALMLAGARMARIGLLGGSFNPAHRGHRRISLQAMRALGLDEVWWLVSPGNPLKEGAKDMAPFEARLRLGRAHGAARAASASAISSSGKARATPSTPCAALKRRYPQHRFIWLLGSDTLPNFHKWRDWRGLAREVPIAVIRRPGYDSAAHAARAMGWLRRFVHPSSQARHWTDWSAPAIIFLRLPPDPTSATAIRAQDPHWHRRSHVARPARRVTACHCPPGDPLTERPAETAARARPHSHRRRRPPPSRASVARRRPGAGGRFHSARREIEHRRPHGDRVRPLDPPGRVDGG